MLAVYSESWFSLPLHINTGKGYDCMHCELQDLSGDTKKNFQEKCIISKELVGKMDNIIYSEMILLNKKWVQGFEGLHPNPTMCQGLRCKRLSSKFHFSLFFWGDVGCGCYFPDFCTCTSFHIENLEAAIKVELQGRERLRRIGSPRASCQ